MNRRRFLELLGTAAAASGIVYSFPSVIVPRNVMRPPLGLMGLIDNGYTLAGVNGDWLLFYEGQLVEAKRQIDLNAWASARYNAPPWVDRLQSLDAYIARQQQ